jgi:hypothetical protein
LGTYPRTPGTPEPASGINPPSLKQTLQRHHTAGFTGRFHLGFRLKPVAINKRRRGTMLGKTGIISPQSAIARATEQVHSYVAICRYTRAQVKSLESEGRIADS